MKETIKALFLTKYSREGASSRYRFLQYFPYLESQGIRCDFSPLTDSRYLNHLYSMKRGSVLDYAKALARRLWAISGARKYDVVIVEYEILPFSPPVFENMLNALGIPYIANYDDAVFYRYSQHQNRFVRRVLGRKIDIVMRQADLVIAGNNFLAEYALNSGSSRVEVIPTAVDLKRYPIRRPAANRIFTIGWIGSPSTTKYLTEISPALKEVCDGGRAKVVLIGAGKVELTGVPVETRPWSEPSEVTDLESCDVGIMPLHNGLWERGKCGLKTIQYMACGLPVVVSPIGVNAEIVEEGVNGFLASDNTAWARALSMLRDDVALRQRMGKAGRRKAEAVYSINVTAPKMAYLIWDVVERSRTRAGSKKG
ncbi:MAG: glycosyltransferase family 4 protein [Candidatus Omnitrophica bacterium]|nr:glycosyltransferase family 4 protein [Candidatus Omnitrophota bacterium]MCM8791388.1 glycosyltransferase family 4 protein [Candidatus Omnitrophota bacterium]